MVADNEQRSREIMRYSILDVQSDPPGPAHGYAYDPDGKWVRYDDHAQALAAARRAALEEAAEVCESAGSYWCCNVILDLAERDEEASDA